MFWGTKDTAVNKMSPVLASWSLHFQGGDRYTHCIGYWIKLKKTLTKKLRWRERVLGCEERVFLLTVEWSGERKLCQHTGGGQLRGAKALRLQLAGCEARGGYVSRSGSRGDQEDSGGGGEDSTGVRQVTAVWFHSVWEGKTLGASGSSGVIRFCSEGFLGLLGWERAGRGQE